MNRRIALGILAIVACASWVGHAAADNDVNTITADLRAAAQRDFFVYHNDLFPGFLLHAKGDSLYLFQDLDKAGLSAPVAMAWSEGTEKSIKTAKAPAKTGAKLAEPWIVVWFSGGKGWSDTKFRAHDFNRSPSFKPAVGPIDVPWLIVLQHNAVATLDATGLSLKGDGALEHVIFMPLFGSQKLNPAETAAWANGLPADVVGRARQWAAISRRLPVYVKEDYQVSEAEDEVRIRNSFEYLDITDDWKTPAMTIAPVAPVVALAYPSALRLTFDNAPTDLDTVTHWGPYMAVRGKESYTYTIGRILKYIDEVENVKSMREDTPGFADVRKLLISRMNTALEKGTDPRGAYSIDWGMGMIGAWMRAVKLLPEDMGKRVSAKIKDENYLNGYFLSPDTYVEEKVKLGPTKEVPVLIVKARKGLQSYSDDLVKQTLRMPYVVWQYGYYSGDWATVQQRYDVVKKMYGFNLLLGWSNVGPEYTAEHAKISALQGPIGLARLAKQFKDEETYDYGAYLLAKAIINEWVWDEAAVKYIKSHSPWVFNTDGDWIMHQNHGYVGLLGLPMDQLKTYQEIPLVLDRFNREMLRDFNDYYVRMRHKYFPGAYVDNVYVTDVGDAADLKSLYTKPLTDSLKPEILRKQSHLSPGYYNYPIDLMELTATMEYTRLYDANETEKPWHRGLDSLSRGQSWRQLAIALRKDWNIKNSGNNPWPYPAWYLMNARKQDKSFNNDCLPFGEIKFDLKRSPKGDRSEVRPNWNSLLTAGDL